MVWRVTSPYLSSSVALRAYGDGFCHRRLGALLPHQPHVAAVPDQPNLGVLRRRVLNDLAARREANSESEGGVGDDHQGNAPAYHRLLHLCAHLVVVPADDQHGKDENALGDEGQDVSDVQGVSCSVEWNVSRNTRTRADT